MDWRRQRLPSVSARSKSMRHKIAYGLVIVRLILVPVLLLAVFYLLRMGSIVGCIVSVDASFAMQAERASIVMLDVQRTEPNCFLLHDPADLKANQQTVGRLQKMILSFRKIQPQGAVAIKKCRPSFKPASSECARRSGEPAKRVSRGWAGLPAPYSPARGPEQNPPPEDGDGPRRDGQF